MIELHRLNGELFLLNSDIIETVEVTPDSVLRLFNGYCYIVRETPAEICDKIVAFRRLAGYSCVMASALDESKDPEPGRQGLS